MRALLLAALLPLAVLAGCVSPADETPASTMATDPKVPAPHVLQGAAEPADLVAPAFKVLKLAAGGPVYGDGEPAIASSLNGTLYVSFPGCDEGGIGPAELFLGVGGCAVGPVYRSADGGATWKRLSKAGGRLADDGKAANGDADVTVDAGGQVFVSNLGNGIEVQRSPDGGDTWLNVGNAVPEKDLEQGGVDRNWMVAGKAGHLIVNWMGGADRSVGVRATFDSGATWSNVTYISKNIGWQGSVQLAPDGTAYIPFTQPATAPDLVPGAGTCKLMVARSLDGGLTWETLDTNVSVRQAASSFHFSCVLMAPAMTITGDGHLVWVYSEEEHDPLGLTVTGATTKVIASGDGGATWSKPFAVLGPYFSTIMPWASGGAGDRVAITFYGNKLPGDPDRVGLWDVAAAVIDGVGGPEPKVVLSVIDENVHQGGICSQGGACFLTGTDRALLDYFENTLLPDGRLAVVYGADPLEGGKYIDIRVAVQSGGTPLLVAPAAG